MGARGPIPKRSADRRRQNKPERGREITSAPGASRVLAPAADRTWHKTARRWYASLADSGQSHWYEPSDWATAYLIAESMSRDLSPQVIGLTTQGAPVMGTVPLKGANLSAYIKAMSNLLVTGGDRRRMGVELHRYQAVDRDAVASVTAIADFQRRLAGE